MLRLLLTSAARTSSRSLFTKPNEPIYMSSLRPLSSQNARASPLSHKKSTTSQKESSGSHNQMAGGGWLLLGMGLTGLWMHSLLSHLHGGKDYKKFGKKDLLCQLDCHPKLEESVLKEVTAKLKKVNDDSRDEGNYVWKAPMVEPFEDAKVSFYLSRPVCRNWFDRDGTDVMYNVGVIVHTPWFSTRPSLKEMCDSLKLRGIEVECSEDGIRRGLSEYALKYAQDTVRMHLEKKCGNCDLSTGPRIVTDEPKYHSVHQDTDELEKTVKICRTDRHPRPPPTTDPEWFKKGTLFKDAKVSFEITRPIFMKWLAHDGTHTCLAIEVNVHLPHFTATADMKQISDGFKRHGINIEPTERGVRRGLAEYALKHMNDGVNKHLETKCDCGYFSATPFVVPKPRPS